MRSRHADIDPEILHFQVELGTEMGIAIGSCLKSYVLCVRRLCKENMTIATKFLFLDLPALFLCLTTAAGFPPISRVVRAPFANSGDNRASLDKGNECSGSSGNEIEGVTDAQDQIKEVFIFSARVG